MGKTAFALNIAANVAKNARSENETGARGGRVLIFSLEMAPVQLATRILSSEAQISGDQLRAGDLREEDLDKLVYTSAQIEAMPLLLDEVTHRLTVADIRQRLRRASRKFGTVDLIIIDYLQLMRPSEERRDEGPVYQIADITRGLKLLAREFHVPVLLLSQLSRGVESRLPPVPQLSDLRDSGAIEQDADVVMFIYRAEYYLSRRLHERREQENDEQFQKRIQKINSELENVRNQATILIAKHRNGPTGNHDLYFNTNYTRFGDPIERRHEAPANTI